MTAARVTLAGLLLEEGRMGQLIGQILVEMGVLNSCQVDKILSHQQLSRQRFGQIAVGWGWVTPQDVWQAWALQLTADTQVIDLNEMGIDSAATERVPPAIAWHYQVVAMRTWGDNLVLAVPEALAEQARRELPALLDAHLFFCVGDARQVQEALQRIHAMPA